MKHTMMKSISRIVLLVSVLINTYVLAQAPPPPQPPGGPGGGTGGSGPGAPSSPIDQYALYLALLAVVIIAIVGWRLYRAKASKKLQA